MDRYMARRAVAALVLAVALWLASVTTVRGQAPAETPVQTPAVATPQLTLEDALRLALERNLELEDARLELQRANAQVREAWGHVMPRADLSSTYTRNLTVPAQFLPARIFDPGAGEDDVLAVRFGTDNQWALQVTGEQPLFAASAFLGVGTAGRFRTLQTEAVRGRSHEVVTRVRLAFYDVLLAQEAVRLSEKSVGRVRQVLEETRALHRAGVASAYDVLRLEVELANIEPNLRRSRNAAAAARRTLAIELGIDPAAAPAAAGSLATMELAEGAANDAANRSVLRVSGLDAPESRTRDELVAVALDARSDLRQLALVERLRHTEMRLEQAEYLPRLGLFGTYLIHAQQSGSPAFFGGDAGPRAYGRMVGVQLTLPVFSGFQRPARVEQRRATLRQAQAQYRLAVERSEHQVETLLDQVTEARARAELQREAVSRAERAFAMVGVQYREGISSQLEVTDAEVALRQSEFNYAEAVYDYLSARAQLDAATGRVPEAGAIAAAARG
jgi:outer membrane protein